MHQELVTRRTA